MITLDNFVNQLVWVIPVTLLAIALLQTLYVLWLRLTTGRRRTIRQPDSPIMPTRPQGGIPTNHTPYHTGQAGEDSSIGKMVIINGLVNTREVPFPNNQFGIGRFPNPEHNIYVDLDEKSISRRHATITVDEMHREYFLSDTKSTYGTYLQLAGEFQRIETDTRVRLYNEDVVRFGNVVTVRFVLPCGTRPI